MKKLIRFDTCTHRTLESQSRIKMFVNVYVSVSWCSFRKKPVSIIHELLSVVIITTATAASVATSMMTTMMIFSSSAMCCTSKTVSYYVIRRENIKQKHRIYKEGKIKKHTHTQQKCNSNIFDKLTFMRSSHVSLNF